MKIHYFSYFIYLVMIMCNYQPLRNYINAIGVIIKKNVYG